MSQNASPSIATVHTSDRSTFKKCRLQWHFSSPLRLNLEPIRAKQPLTFGTAVHKGLEVYYDPSRDSRSPQAAVKAFDAELTSWLASLPNPDPEDYTNFEEMLGLGYDMLEYYCKWAAKHDKEYFDVVLAVEEKFDFVFPVLNKPEHDYDEVHYAGKLDGLVQDKHGRYWIMEHKTAQQLPSNTEYLLMDDQCGSYILAYLETKGIHVEGIIYNILRKKAPVPLKRNKNGLFSVDKRQDTTYELAETAFLKEYGEIPEYGLEFMDMLKDKGENFILRETVHRNSKEIQALKTSISMEIDDMLGNPHIYRTPNSFNCGNCSFVGPCIAYFEGGDVDVMLHGGYKEKD